MANDDAASTLPKFNPGNNPVVDGIKSRVEDGIKSRVEDLIPYLREAVPDNRERSLAITNIEQGAMWAVKANFTT